jgi:drug/metabolite transporter (DMT)-like permease
MTLRRNGRASTALFPALGLLLLSLLWAADSLRGELFPQLEVEGLSFAQRQGLLCSVFAVVAAGLAVMRRVEFPRGRSAWACAGVGLGLIVIPSALVALVQDWISAVDRVAIFTLTPVFAVVLEPYLQGSEPRRGSAALAGALCAVAGILALFPLQAPGSLRAGAALCALVAATVCIAVTNCLGVGLARTIAGRSTLAMAAQAGAASAVCFAAASLFTSHPVWRWNALLPQLLWLLSIELPAMFLLFWLLRRVAASRMTARFLLAPLFAIVAEIVLQPMVPSLQGWMGLALLAGGSGWLVFAPAERTDAEERGDLLKLFPDDLSRRPPQEE